MRGSFPRTTALGDDQMVLKLSIACALSALFLGLVIANAVALPLKSLDPISRTGWVTTVFKNPH
jgi:hypothetical protein